MKVRLMVGALLATPAVLVATATSGHAASVQGAVAFAGRLTIVPGGSGSTPVCFDALSCATDGAAAGAVLAKPITGMHGTFAYTEGCTLSVPYAPTGVADLDVTFPEVPGAPDVNVRWQRFGQIAVITGRNGYVAGGAAVVAPAPKQAAVPVCGAPIDLVVTGAMAFA